MEEILASIRRIIADDDASKPAGKPVTPASAVDAALQHPNASPPQPSPASPASPPKNNAPEEATRGGGDPPGGAFAEPDSQDILELTELMTAPEGADAQNFQTIDGQSDVIFSDAPSQSEPPPRISEEPRRQPSPSPGPSPSPDPTLISPSTTAAVDSAFNTLAQTVLVHNARTLEDLVREMLRPMLKSWLDDNLPGMVERIVKAEIERVSRGRS